MSRLGLALLLITPSLPTAAGGLAELSHLNLGDVLLAATPTPSSLSTPALPMRKTADSTAVSKMKRLADSERSGDLPLSSASPSGTPP